jgi:hypothetical protein
VWRVKLAFLAFLAFLAAGCSMVDGLTDAQWTYCYMGLPARTLERIGIANRGLPDGWILRVPLGGTRSDSNWVAACKIAYELRG